MIINSKRELLDLLNKISKVDVVALDTETDGLHRFCEVVGISVALSPKEAYYVPYKIYSVETGLYCPWEQPGIIEYFVSEVCKKKIICHNAQYDQKAIMNTFGVYFLDNLICDTLCLAHCVYREERPLGLKDLAAELLDPNAKAPQDDVKESVKRNGGTTTKAKFEMYKCDYEILGNYAAHDTLYTYGLYEKLYPELEKQDLLELWHEEVLPLVKVTYQLNTVGVRIDVPYFEQLKAEMQEKITKLENDIYQENVDEIRKYEIEKLKREIKITPTSAFGKHLITKDFASVSGKGKEKVLQLSVSEQVLGDELYRWYCEKEQCDKVFNIDSGDDKAFLIYTISEIPCEKKTDSGKMAVDADTLESLTKEHPDKAALIHKILERAGEQKLLSTYVQPLLDNHVNGRIYTTFNQTGTTSGRYSSSEPINLQTLPRDDKRIKKGFIPDDGWVFIGDDYESLEPKIFAHISGEENIRKVYREGLDLYSQVGIDVYGLKDVSSKEGDANFLKNVNPNLRQLLKVATLATVYGAGAGRLAQATGSTYDEMVEFVAKYMEAYPNLKKWMDEVDAQILAQGFVRNIVGRKRRASLMFTLKSKYGVSDFSKKGIERFWNRNRGYDKFESPADLFYACKNNRDNAKNFLIQSVGASVINAAIIELMNRIKQHKLQGYPILNVHDELIITCPKNEADLMANLLQDCMENNKVTRMLSVKMKAIPVVTDKSLAEAK